MKRDVHQRLTVIYIYLLIVIVIHIQYKFHEIPLRGLLSYGSGRTNRQNYVPVPSAGVKKKT